ncbi:MAG: hypothetical protein JXA37_13020 [Chloroflexia bacterium]|nr:hypothetical protein [Chloroflexia bacterium]
MFQEFWKSLSGSFEKRWLVNVFGPALIFWGGGLWVWAQMEGVDNALKLWKGYATESQIFLGVAGLLLVFLSAILLESFAGPLLRFYEGYWLRWTALANRRAKGLREMLERRRLLRTKIVKNQATAAERAESVRLDAELVHRPQDPDRSMPTQLGDILRAAEDYARNRYGLDPVTFWPRLFSHLSDPLREALDTAQAQMDLALRLTTLMVFHGIIWSIIVSAQGQWNVLWWTLPALLLAWLLWRAAHQPATSYAGLLRSAFDVHRLDVYESMHWPLPTSPRTESSCGRELIVYLVDGTVAEGIIYTKDEKEEDKKEDGQDSGS